MPLLSLSNLSKSFDTTRAVNDVSLGVEQGEFFGLLGPSGCGKTTTLRMIAGLEKPDVGSIEFEGKDITNLPPERRGFGMVFQNYALFPHLNVFENVAFGLRARHKSKLEMNDRVNSALDLVQLPGYAKRRVDGCLAVNNSACDCARIAIEPAASLRRATLKSRRLVARRNRVSYANSLRVYDSPPFTSHDQRRTFALCDRIAVMVAGS
jgi:iron(III) transport system ATP-binding protein